MVCNKREDISALASYWKLEFLAST